MRETEIIDVLADDFTGAMDAGVQFAQAGLDTALALSASWRGKAQVHVISSNSRDVDAPEAAVRVQRALGLLRGGAIYKKVDSTMRGHIGLEVQATLDATGLEKAAICPALIQQGRMVRDGRLYVRGLPLAESDFGRDPAWPAASSEMADLVGMPSTHLGLAKVRAGVDSLARAIAAASTRAVTLDAVSSEDVETIGRAALLGGYLPCGSLGLAQAWAAGITGGARPRKRPLSPVAKPALIIAGSQHPNTTAQVKRLLSERNVSELVLRPGLTDGANRVGDELGRGLASGRSVALRFPDERIGAEAAGRLVKEVFSGTGGLFQESRLGALVIVGGETAGWVCEALSVEAVRLMGQVLVGIPWGLLAGGRADGLVVVTKAGGFGDDRALLAIHDALR